MKRKNPFHNFSMAKRDKSVKDYEAVISIPRMKIKEKLAIQKRKGSDYGY